MREPLVALQNLLPQPWLARTFGRLARSRRPWLRTLLIRAWMRAFGVSLDDCVRRSPDHYASFEDFFTRELALGARPMPVDPYAVVAPVDGYLRAFGRMSGEVLMQIKGSEYSLGALLGEYGNARTFRDGWYATFYLSPADYHRVHAPTDATLRRTILIPGQAFSVTSGTQAAIPGLYCRNERLVCFFDTPAGGSFALIMVGAMLVTGIETVWRPAAPIERWTECEHHQPFARGDELGRFTLGSTVVLVLPAHSILPRSDLAIGERMHVGRELGSLPARD